MRLLRQFRTEAAWLVALALTGALYAAYGGAGVEARRFNCFYYPEYDRCFDWFVLDCSCVP